MKKPHYYIHDGTTTKEVLSKLDKDKRLREIYYLLRYATGSDRQDLLEEQSRLKEE